MRALKAAVLWIPVLALALGAWAAEKGGGAAAARAVPDVLDVAPVWSGHPVRFALLTCGRRQFVAFYDADRQLTVAARQTDEPKWHFVKLPTRVVWDSHNYITMTADDEGLLHLAGNMHNVPLIYFRTEKPYDIATFKQVPSMVGREENSCTYPIFLRGVKNELLFTYRDGRSGNGNQIWNIYDAKTHAWRRLLDQPLFSGEGKMNAYFRGPVRGPDGLLHVVWVWRDRSGCEMNHDLSYARTRDLVHWETGAGKPLVLPITIKTGEIVDPVPTRGGIINGNVAIGWDSKGRPVISYHKYDAKGQTQLYNARLEDGRWKIYQTSQWTSRWDFSGGGSIHFEVHVSPVSVGSRGRLVQPYHNEKEGSGAWVLDEATLRPVETAAAVPMTVLHAPAPAAGQTPAPAAGKTPAMQVNWAADSGAPDEKGVVYRLRWETLGPNRDRPRETAPPPTMLRLYRYSSS